jgi:hypothetical protein
LDLCVEDEHKSPASSSDHVGQAALEESRRTFVLSDFPEAIHRSGVHFVRTAGLHHESPSHGVQRVGEEAGANSYDLSEEPHLEDASVLLVGEE